MFNIIINIFLIAFCIFMSLLFMILFIKFDYDFKVKIDKNVTGIMTFKWLFGLLKIEVIKDKPKMKIKIYLRKICINLGEMRSKEKKNKRKKHKITFKFPSEELIVDTIILINKVFQEIRPRTFTISGVYGFEDPAYTGITSAAICFMKQIVPKCEMFLTPIFDNKIINAEIEVGGNLRVFIATYLVLKFSLIKRGRKFWKIIRP